MITCHDERTGLRAIVAIDDTTLGPGFGGVRYRSYPSTTAAAREAHPGLPVILATGYASPGALDAERARGMVVEKPFRLGELADAIRNATG